ncbi:MAG: c-type cytochrome [Alphaproteobacteria bacterium]
MNSFELNKIAAAVLFSILFVMVLGFLAEAIYAPKHPAKPGMMVEVTSAESAAPSEAAPAPMISLSELLQNGDAARGEKVAKKCAACHTFDRGGANRIGPNLYNVAGRAMGAGDGFKYSDAMRTKGADGGQWSYDQLFGFLLAPRKFAKGTTMGFSGIKSETKRADLLVYLQSISPGAPDLP